MPPSMRELPLKALCLVRMGWRRPVPAASGEPVYVIGNFQAGGGISRSAQLYATQIRKRYRHCICVDSSKEMLQEANCPSAEGSLRSIADIRNDVGAGTVIVHLNPPQFLWLLCLLRRSFFRHKHLIAYWAWEFEDIPSLWKFALRFVDTVEVPSTFTRGAVARNTEKTVRVHPHLVPKPTLIKQAPAQEGKLRCLFIFDMASLCSRKNPQAAIAAFVRAFTPEEAQLTIKVSQAGSNAADWRQLQALSAPHAHIRLIDTWMDDAELEHLFLTHDVYLSLHRSEGYGLTIREAMLHNLYVVATGWSGNMDFMHGERVFPVSYTLKPVDKTEKVFRGVRNPRWAEPDIKEAAAILQHIHRMLISRNVLHTAEGDRF